MKDNDKMPEKLAEVGNHNPFLIPQDYFGNFEHKMMDKIKLEMVQTPKRRIWIKLQSQLALAAVIIGFTLIGYVGFNYILQKQGVLPNQIPENEIISYLNQQSDYMETNALIDQVSEQMQDPEIPLDKLNENEYGDEITIYLLNHEFDEKLITNEL